MRRRIQLLVTGTQESMVWIEGKEVSKKRMASKNRVSTEPQGASLQKKIRKSIISGIFPIVEDKRRGDVRF